MAVGDSKKVKLRKAMYQANMRKNRHKDRLYQVSRERDVLWLAVEFIALKCKLPYDSVVWARAWKAYSKVLDMREREE